MFRLIFELLKATTIVSLLLAAAAGAVFFVYVFVLTCFRLMQVLWIEIFSKPWY